MDHNVPTLNRGKINDPTARLQVETLEANCEEYGVELANINHPEQGIVHIIGPELGLTQPGKTIVCGDSHTSTQVAFGARAFGIVKSEIDHFYETQTLRQEKQQTLNVKVEGDLGVGVTAKDLILAIIAKYTVNMGTGYVIEFTGKAIEEMTMEERMTVCNMSIEAGARAGLIRPDQTTVDYLRGRKNVPKGEEFEQLAEEWLALKTDENAVYDKTLTINAAEIEPQVTW